MSPGRSTTTCPAPEHPRTWRRSWPDNRLTPLTGAVLITICRPAASPASSFAGPGAACLDKSQPGSDYQTAHLTLDAGNARDIMLLLLDVHAVLAHLYLDGTQPQIPAPAEDYLRESASPYTLPALIDALGEATGQLSHAEHQALGSIPPDPTASEPARSNPAATI